MPVLRRHVSASDGGRAATFSVGTLSGTVSWYCPPVNASSEMTSTHTAIGVPGSTSASGILKHVGSYADASSPVSSQMALIAASSFGALSATELSTTIVS